MNPLNHSSRFCLFIFFYLTPFFSGELYIHPGWNLIQNDGFPELSSHFSAPDILWRFNTQTKNWEWHSQSAQVKKHMNTTAFSFFASPKSGEMIFFQSPRWQIWKIPESVSEIEILAGWNLLNRPPLNAEQTFSFHQNWSQEISSQPGFCRTPIPAFFPGFFINYNPDSLQKLDSICQNINGNTDSNIFACLQKYRIQGILFSPISKDHSIFSSDISLKNLGFFPKEPSTESVLGQANHLFQIILDLRLLQQWDLQKETAPATFKTTEFLQKISPWLNSTRVLIPRTFAHTHFIPFPIFEESNSKLLFTTDFSSPHFMDLSKNDKNFVFHSLIYPKSSVLIPDTPSSFEIAKQLPFLNFPKITLLAPASILTDTTKIFDLCLDLLSGGYRCDPAQNPDSRQPLWLIFDSSPPDSILTRTYLTIFQPSTPSISEPANLLNQFVNSQKSSIDTVLWESKNNFHWVHTSQTSKEFRFLLQKNLASSLCTSPCENLIFQDEFKAIHLFSDKTTTMNRKTQNIENLAITQKDSAPFIQIFANPFPKANSVAKILVLTSSRLMSPATIRVLTWENLKNAPKILGNEITIATPKKTETTQTISLKIQVSNFHASSEKTIFLTVPANLSTSIQCPSPQYYPPNTPTEIFCEITNPDFDSLEYEWTAQNLQFSTKGQSAYFSTPPKATETMIFELELRVFDQTTTVSETVLIKIAKNKRPLAFVDPLTAEVTSGWNHTFYASGSDGDKDSLIYQWKQISGPEAEMIFPTPTSMTFSAPQTSFRTEMKFELLAYDGTEFSQPVTGSVWLNPKTCTILGGVEICN